MTTRPDGAGVARYGYEPRTRRYRDNATGRFVAPAVVRDAVDQVIDAEQARVSDLSVRLVNGQISLADWQGQMAARVKNLHVALGLVANGGLANTSAADLGFLGSLIKKQYRFLDRFARQVQSGAQSLDGSLVARANLYAQAARPTYEQMVARLANNGGATEEQSVLGGAEHCSECLDQAALGWQPIGTLIPIGERQCLANCHCRMSYR